MAAAVTPSPSNRSISPSTHFGTSDSPVPNSAQCSGSPPKNPISKESEDLTVTSTNSKVKAFQCYKCTALFSVKYRSKYHFLKKHPNEKYMVSEILQPHFKCYVCPLSFEVYNQLEKHFEQVHGDLVLHSKQVYVGESGQTASILFSRIKKPTTPQIQNAATSKEKSTQKKVAQKLPFFIFLNPDV